MAENETSRLNRRGFLTTATAGTLTLLARGATAAPKDKPAAPARYEKIIKLGVIGCGGRGKFVARLFAKHGGYKIVACADYFQDRADELGKLYGVPDDRRYDGLNCYKKLLAGDVDAVAIESPPYFHPSQAAAAVDAGKHVFVAKPIAVDVPGCQSIADSGRKATAKKQVFLVDFQTRANELYQEAVKRVQNGDIGRIVNGVAVYYCGMIFGGHQKYFDTHKNDPSAKLRSWCIFRSLSGDIITEQNIHALDVASWIMDAPPVAAMGVGGRKARTGSGDINDHFNVVYTFPGDTAISFTSRQFGKGEGDIGCTVFGSRGTVDTHYFGSVSIAGDTPYKGGDVKGLYASGAANNVATFYQSILKGIVHNPTVAPSVRSNLTTILGRTAADTGRIVTWAEMMKANETLPHDLAGLKA